MHILEQKVRQAMAEDRYAVIPFLTAGYPDEETFWKAIADMDQHGADIIEVGVPFSDPVADGPVIEAASRQVLADGVSLAGILENFKLRRDFLKASIVLMGYFNPFMQYGWEKLAKDMKDAGISGIIIPDLPFEEAGPYREIMKAQGIALIALVGPNTSEERMQLYADVSEGYAYVISVLGTTGEREKVAPMVATTLRRAKSVFKLPIAMGFGLSHPEQLDVLPEDAQPDAVVFGSALVKYLAEGNDAAEFMQRWEGDKARRRHG